MEIINLTLQHIFITLTSVMIATIIAIPLAILIYKKSFYVNSVLSVISLLQSFPSLALFAILVPLLGIGINVAIFALFLYALMPLFINTILGFKSINPEYYKKIKTLNITNKDIFFKIEMPLVLPYIVSGIKLTMIYTLSYATMVTLIGAGGLGNLIYLGLQELNIWITLQGVIPLMILTVLTNVIFNKIEKMILPEDVRRLNE